MPGVWLVALVLALVGFAMQYARRFPAVQFAGGLAVFAAFAVVGADAVVDGDALKATLLFLLFVALSGAYIMARVRAGRGRTS